MKKFTISAIFFVLANLTGLSFAEGVIVYGPKQVNRTKGKPNIFMDNFEASAVEGTISIKNGNEDGSHRMSSALIFLNGKQIFGPDNFNQQVYRLEKTLNLMNENFLRIEIRSKPDSFIIVEVSAEDIGRQVSFEGPPEIDPAVLDTLPKSDEGRPILIEIPGMRLELDLDRRDPITVLGNCTGWIATCVSPGERSIDDCTRSVPICKTDTPWFEEKICCPAACFEQYRTERLNGSDPLDALEEVYFKDASCFPEVTGLRTLQGEG